MEWTEIALNNCDKVYDLYEQGIPIHIAHKCFDGEIIYGSKDCFSSTFNTMAKYGDYYYIALPKLK